MIQKGLQIFCIDPIEGYLTGGFMYELQQIESYAGRAVITDDRGKEGHFKPERFMANCIFNNRALYLRLDKIIILDKAYSNPDLADFLKEFEKVYEEVYAKSETNQNRIQP